MAQMMKQMGVDMDELDAEKVEIDLGDKKLVFSNPEVSRINAKGNEVFQLNGKYSKEEKNAVDEQDLEMVLEKTDASRSEAKEALKDSKDPAEAIMSLQ